MPGVFYYMHPCKSSGLPSKKRRASGAARRFPRGRDKAQKPQRQALRERGHGDTRILPFRPVRELPSIVICFMSEVISDSAFPMPSRTTSQSGLCRVCSSTRRLSGNKAPLPHLRKNMAAWLVLIGTGNYPELAYSLKTLSNRRTENRTACAKRFVIGLARNAAGKFNNAIF